MKMKFLSLYTLLVISANTPTYPMDTSALTITHNQDNQGPKISDEELHAIQNITSAAPAQEDSVGNYVVEVIRPSRIDYFVNGILAAVRRNNTINIIDDTLVEVVDGTVHIDQLPQAVVKKGGMVTIHDRGTDEEKGILTSEENPDGGVTLFLCKYPGEAVGSTVSCQERIELVKAYFDDEDKVKNIEIINPDLTKIQADGSVHAGLRNGAVIIHTPSFSEINYGKSISEAELHASMATTLIFLA